MSPSLIPLALRGGCAVAFLSCQLSLFLLSYAAAVVICLVKGLAILLIWL